VRGRPVCFDYGRMGGRSGNHSRTVIGKREGQSSKLLRGKRGKEERGKEAATGLRSKKKKNSPQRTLLSSGERHAVGNP